MYITNCPETLLIFLVISLAEASPWTVSNPEDVIADSSQIEVSYEPVQDVRSYQYAWSYPYYRRPRDTYMEKKVYETVARGGVYIEGLRSALQAAVDELQNCSGLYLKETTDTPVVACRALTRRNQRARRLAQLALWAARQIRQEPHGELSDPHEIKSLIRLAGILDQLAQLTGYEPKPEDYLTTTAAAPAPSTEAMTFPPLLEAASFNVSEEIIAAMVNCLDKSNNDSRPAYERCPRAPIPAGLQTLFNITDPGSGDNLNTPSTDNPTVVRRRKSTSTHSETIDEPSYRKPERRSARPSTRTVDYRLPEDPYQDISGYSKSKEGVSIMPNPEQAEQVRLALERHFASPDMETVRRYGSNYNPLIPNAPLAGMIRTLLDI